MYPFQVDILFVLAIISVIAIILAFYIISSIRIFRNVKSLRISTNKNLIRQEEKLKAHIAAELHDELSASLAAIKLNLQCIKSSDEELMEFVNKTEREIELFAPKIRSISHNLMPPNLTRIGLSAAINEMASRVSDNSKMNVTVSMPGMYLPQELSLQIFRLVQEIFTNAIKHSQADTLMIEISMQQHHLLIKIEDNGIGFDLAKTLHFEEGIGIANIYSRVEILEGKLELITEQSKGVRYKIRIPV